MAGLMTKGRCDTRYCGKALEEVKVVEMMPRIFGINKRVCFGQGLTVSQVLEVLTAKAAGRKLAKLTNQTVGAASLKLSQSERAELAKGLSQLVIVQELHMTLPVM
ncbi:hypothetical protein EK904_001050 [Melospiza melodia maxima]|nr:hypothetical protein EK904_001050 [Melospiza melodia maxima]